MKNNDKAFSPALFKDNMRRFMPICMAAFLACFLSGPFVLISNRDWVSTYTVSNMLSNLNIGFVAVEIALPVAAAAAVFRYLTKVNSVNVMHSMPFSRKTLFVTNAVSGLALTEIPFVLTAVCFGLLKLSGILTFQEDITYSSSLYPDPSAAAADLFTGIAILRWLFIASVTVIFIFAMCTLGAVISGTSVISFLTGCALNVLVPVLYLGVFAYAATYLYGFNDALNEDLLAGMHPMLYFVINRVILGQGTFAANMLTAGLLFLLAAAAIFALAFYAYVKRPNEKTGDSYVFGWVSLSIEVILTVLGSSLIGLVFSDDFGIWGFIIGGVISLLISQMIVEGTARIFNKNIIKPLVISAIMIALLLCVFIFDLTGYSRKTPAVGSVDSVELSCGAYCEGRRFTVTDKAQIEAICGLHKSIADARYDRLDYDDPALYDENGELRWTYVDVVYNLSNGREMSREYSVPQNKLKGSGVFEQVAASCDTASNFAELKVLDPDDCALFISAYGILEDRYAEATEGMMDFDQYIAFLPAADKKRLFDALADDVASIGPEDLWYDYYNDLRYPNAYVSIEYENFDIPEDLASSNYERWGSAMIRESILSEKYADEEHFQKYYKKSFTFDLDSRYERSNAVIEEYVEDFMNKSGRK